MEALFETISRRLRPEDVAQMIMETLGDSLTHYERRILNRAAAGSLKHALAQFTSMMEDFAWPVAPERQVRKAVELVSTAYPISTARTASQQIIQEQWRACGVLPQNFVEARRPGLNTIEVDTTMAVDDRPDE